MPTDFKLLKIAIICLKMIFNVMSQCCVRFHQQVNFIKIFLYFLVNHPVLSDIIGSFLIHRPDINYSITLFNMAATFFYYTNSN
jgi:hypothetical protein